MFLKGRTLPIVFIDLFTYLFTGACLFSQNNKLDTLANQNHRFPKPCRWAVDYLASGKVIEKDIQPVVTLNIHTDTAETITNKLINVTEDRKRWTQRIKDIMESNL